VAGKRYCCENSDEGRRLLPWYSLINGIGALIATGYSGSVASGGRIPWAGLLSICVYICGFVLPLIIEHRRLGAGFDQIEASYRANRHREINPPREEVFAPRATPETLSSHRRRRAPTKLFVACAIIATVLLGFDIGDLLVNMPQTVIPNDRISNF